MKRKRPVRRRSAMAEEVHDSGERPEDDAAVPRLLRGLILGALGVAAAFRFLTREEKVPTPAPVAEPPGPEVEEVHHPDGRIEHPHVRYESTDARFRPILLVLLALLTFSPPSARAQPALPPVLRQVDFEQRLDAEAPLDVQFKDEHDQTVRLGQYFGDKPVILVLAYFRCPMLCTEVLNGL